MTLDRGLYLRVMDNNIVKKLLYPTAEGGSKLLQDLKVYNEYFGKLMRLLIINKEKVLKTVAAMAEFKEEDRFFNKVIDYDKLKTDFGWTDSELQEVHNLISESHHLWDNFKKKYLHIGLSK